MDLLKDSAPLQGAMSNDQTKSAGGKLNGEDLARLRVKREEIIMVLQLWHGYGRSAADRALSNWLSDRAQGYSDRARQSPLKHNLRRLIRPDA
jgi:hypothetical protein